VPVSLATERDPFRHRRGPPPPDPTPGAQDGAPATNALDTTVATGEPASPPPLRVPQARVLRALVPADHDSDPSDWPLLTRALLGQRAGFTEKSGSVTRALNGIRAGSSSGDAHAGLVALGYVETVDIDLDGVVEVSYRATRAGVAAYLAFLASGGELPPVRDAASATNRRYVDHS
jgi:hypothetical protein